jgi:dihydrolipoamide dehydrogenase
MALERFSKALAMNPRDYETRIRVARLELETAKLDDARQHFRACLDQRPDDPRAVIGLADCLLRAGDPSAAREFYLDADAKVSPVQRVADGVEVTFTDRDGRSRQIIVDHIVAATGRAPNVRGIGLEFAGVETDGRGVPRFDRRTLQCGRSSIFIAGDANNDVPLLHEAADEGRIAGDNAARFPDVRPGLRRTPLAAVFTDPQLATVGERLSALDPETIVTGAVSFENQGRARVMLRNRGLLHVYADVTTGRVLGAEMIGPRAENIAHLLAWSVQSGPTVAEMLERPFYHPVLEEGVRTALRSLSHALQMGPAFPARCLDCGPGA